ncbi:TetR family transcriptional regulator [Sinorhizobium fredii USDA 205]|uniref:TetR family transcriptional regulator n=1 Tax=Rhizobium fredii TaxID=380 RepID=A0A844ANJ4_RHIFR|nr:TetR/AcrR family transcriptional regulator [Sinorhizobium fredii]AWM27192.1 Transcriptional regulator TetR family [Sinorhizobium fredii CCBAU 25509]KSV85431.1 TetR family transcriptional regulator [Sinorhizobium fredii USDA 205]MCG5474730.1 TetR/AcrR family transcriptional regulator [Sinorhizobium fredii]MQW93965.1 TetR family transcriptional regulator [Sinorhizobium fredii]MQX12436.1 TetR family transcriptional regulator [Sinorhizobium fredii]
MQPEKPRRSNRERSDTTRAAILDAARELFIAKGYADTATPDIVAAAGLTRGALYHHFEDKKALFRAVVEQEAGQVAAAIELSDTGQGAPRDALLAGASAYFDAMAMPGRVRLLLLDGPAVLGVAEIAAIDAAHGGRTLQEGLAAAMPPGRIDEKGLAATAVLLSAAFDRAALEIEAGAARAPYLHAIGRLIDGLIDR